MKGFDEATGRSKSPRMSDYADMVVWPEGDYKSYRMVGPVFSIKNIWFTIRTDRKPDGVSIPKMCLDHDGATDRYVTEVCAFRASGLGRESTEYFINVIDREEQEGRRWRSLNGVIRPETHLDHKAYWLKAGDSRLTPCRLLAIPDSQIDKIKGFKKLNKVKLRDGTSVGMDISDPEYGCDINIIFDPNKKGPARYDIQKGDRTPLTEEERRYGIYRPDLLKPLRIEEARREMEDLATKIVKKKSKGGDAERGVRRGRELDDPLMDDSSVRMSEDDLGGRRRSRDDDGYDAPRGRRSRDDDDDGYDAPRRRSRDDDDEPAPRRRSRDDDDDGYDAPRSRRDAPADLDDDFDAPRRRSRDDDDEPAPRRRSRDDDDEPRRRSRDDDDEPAPRRRSRDDDYERRR